MRVEMKLPKIALGAWAWGNDGTFGNNFTAQNLQPIFDTAMANGLNLWDTAYAYGAGTSRSGMHCSLRTWQYLLRPSTTSKCQRSLKWSLTAFTATR